MTGYALIVGSWLLWRMLETRPEETHSEGALMSRSRYSPVLRSPSFLFNAALCMLAMAVILAYVTAAPVQLMVKLGLDMSGFSYWFTDNAALNILACFMAPRLIAKVTKTHPTYRPAGVDALQHRLCHDPGFGGRDGATYVAAAAPGDANDALPTPLVFAINPVL